MDPRSRLTKRERAVYRTSTGLVLAVMLFSIVNFVFNDHFPFPNGPEGAFVHLGFPAYFKVEDVAQVMRTGFFCVRDATDRRARLLSSAARVVAGRERAGRR
jgi:hypothetical protein